MITIPWLILERTDSPAFAGLVAAISALPGAASHISINEV